MSNVTRYANSTQSTAGRGPSPAIFGDLSKIYSDMWGGKCAVFFDDFIATPLHADASASGGYPTQQSSGVTIEGPTSVVDIGEELGVLIVTHDGTDNDEGYIQFGSGGQFRIDNAAGNTGVVLFEARFKKSNVADNGMSVFVGFGPDSIIANALAQDSGALASNTFVGFSCLADDGNQMDTVYRAASQSLVTVEANAVTLVADTYVKVGIKYDPSQSDSKKLRYYVNGVPRATAVNTTNLDTATFPEGDPLCPVFYTKLGSGTAITATLDWVCAVQYLDSVDR